MPKGTSVSDTVTITADGRTVVDIARLLAKEHIRQMITQMRSKTTVVFTRNPRSRDARQLTHATTD
jgi:hypothetical protein